VGSAVDAAVIAKVVTAEDFGVLLRRLPSPFLIRVPED